MTKFTKGPWAKDRRGESLIGANGFPVCVWGCGLSNAQKNDERVANANLIAAAPDMYRMIKELTSTGCELLNVDDIEDKEDSATIHANFSDKIIEALLHLKKARGE